MRTSLTAYLNSSFFYFLHSLIKELIGLRPSEALVRDELGVVVVVQATPKSLAGAATWCDAVCRVYTMQIIDYSII